MFGVLLVLAEQSEAGNLQQTAASNRVEFRMGG
jgi:hypothetical protein